MHSSRTFLLGQAASLVGDGFAVLAVPLIVLRLTDNPVLAGIASAPRALGYLIAGLPAGPLVDRANPWKVLIAADFSRMTIFLLLSATMMLHICPVAAVLGLAVFAGAAGVFFETALAVASRDLFEGEQLLRANAFLETSRQLSLILGPVALGLLAATIGIAAALLVNAATFAISLATVWRAASGIDALVTTIDRVPDSRSRGRRGWAAVRESLAELAEGFRYVAATAVLAGLVTLQVITTFAEGTETLVPYFAKEVLGGSADFLGIVIAGAGIGGVLGAVISPIVAARFGSIELCTLSVLGMAVALALIGAAVDLWWLTVSYALLSAASVPAVIVVRSVRQAIVPRTMLGRVTSSARSAILAASAAGAMVSGVLTRAAGDNPRPVFFLAGAIIAITAPVVWFTSLAPHRAIDALSDRTNQCDPTSS
ncbi:MFS transporter [Nocardia sp. CDC160]|uniref:MFS transporter n=1 Tax=Nocardia sp. CDC160 TaxID=3112166 RepID=UPI002DB9D5D2|nr:MFS transporter [Nocardia sp. CDC160]MEC3920360.1 MFS transporter [Nocardia sp. CDC160]